MRKLLFAWLILAGFVLVACSGKSSASTKIDLTMSDFQFQPDSFRVLAGQEITFNATNAGSVVHNFVIMKEGQSAGPAFDAEDKPNIYWEVEVKPGDTVNTLFTAPADPGKYEVVCRTPHHILAGMVGKLIVVANP